MYDFVSYILLLGGLYFDISVIMQCLNYWLYPRGVHRGSMTPFLFFTSVASLDDNAYCRYETQ